MQYKASNLYIITNDKYPIFPFSHLKLSNQLTATRSKMFIQVPTTPAGTCLQELKRGGAQGITPWGQACYRPAPLWYTHPTTSTAHTADVLKCPQVCK